MADAKIIIDGKKVSFQGDAWGEGLWENFLISQEQADQLKNDQAKYNKAIANIKALGNTDGISDVQSRIRAIITEALNPTLPEVAPIVATNETLKQAALPALPAKTQTTLLNTAAPQPYDPNKLGKATQDVVDGIRANTLYSLNNNNKNPYDSSPNSTGNLQHIVSGSDLSVFFMIELPNIEDVRTGVAKHLWRKELTMIEVDSVMSLGYSIVRDVFPVRTIGRSKPKGFTRGPISIAGHIAFAIFTDDVLVRIRGQIGKNIDAYNSKLKNIMSSPVSGGSKQLQAFIEQQSMFNSVLNTGSIYLLNQLLPFHILVMGTNEYGNFTKMMIKGVRIIDENQLQGVQQPNIMNKVTFAAEDIFPMVSGTTSENGDFSTSVRDATALTGDMASTYSGSQLMRDVAAMQLGDLRLRV